MRIVRFLPRWSTLLFLLVLAAGAVALAILLQPEPLRPVTGGLQAAARGAEGNANGPRLPPELATGFMPLSPVQAREINARTAFSTAPIEVARPFLIPLAERPASAGAALTGFAGRERAAECLTAAIYYEAGSETVRGQRAVAQVVLNRLRHPAFPKSVCAVVYEGAERPTGCQFTFTCDGSLARRPSVAGWARARQVALAALAGAVEPSVGMSTHYHTDWVVPYWASSLDKVTMIGSHIFYRWKGFWGRRSAFGGAYVGEPTTALASVAPAPPADTAATPPQDVASQPENRPRPLADQGGRLPSDGTTALPVTPRLRADEPRSPILADQHPAPTGTF